MSDLDKQLMNADSFDELYLAYYPAMLSYARMFLRDQWAEDVVQDVSVSYTHLRAHET